MSAAQASRPTRCSARSRTTAARPRRWHSAPAARRSTRCRPVARAARRPTSAASPARSSPRATSVPTRSQNRLPVIRQPGAAPDAAPRRPGRLALPSPGALTPQAHAEPLPRRRQRLPDRAVAQEGPQDRHDDCLPRHAGRDHDAEDPAQRRRGPHRQTKKCARLHGKRPNTQAVHAITSARPPHPPRPRRLQQPALQRPRCRPGTSSPAAATSSCSAPRVRPARRASHSPRSSGSSRR